jgi:hypothetical protein
MRPPDERESRPASNRATSQTTTTTSPPRVTPRWYGCPCGCMSIPGFADDPECRRHYRPIAKPYRRSNRRGPWLYVTVSNDGTQILVRGADAEWACSQVHAEPRGSATSRGYGYILPRAYLADLYALAEVEHRFVTVTDLAAKAKAKAS